MATVREALFGRSKLLAAKTHPQYRLTINEMNTVRDCMEGSPTIKRYTYDYLPHPSSLEQNSGEQKVRYAEYIYGAEFHNYPDDTRRTLLGKMRLNDVDSELPQQIEYLNQDFDGDGMSLKGSIEYAINNVLQMKWHVLVSDYQGLSDVDLKSLSIADMQDMQARSSVKQYSRENVVNWHFDRINGAMQLRFIMLLERGYDFDYGRLEHTVLESYLILALDEEGNYYQQKVVYKDTGFEEGERSYVTVNGEPLKWLPVVIVADEELDQNKLPLSMGYLYPICELTLNRYRVSAVYKEAQRNLPPTMMTKGWKSGDMEIFKEANGGRTYIATGGRAVNNLPDEVDYGILSPDTSMDDFHWYFDENEKQIRAMGGTVKKDQGNMTATEADIDANNQNALLENIASSMEDGFKRAISYCAMFEGVWSPEQVEENLEQIQLELPRDFATPKMTVEEVQALMSLHMQGLRTTEQVVNQLAAGGWDLQDAEITLQELESAPPMITDGNVNNLTQDQQE